MADSKKISIRLGIDGADGVKATLSSVGTDGTAALARISDAAKALAPSLATATASMRDMTQSFSRSGTSGFDSIGKSAKESARAMEAAFATEKRAMQAMLDAADPAAAAQRRLAQATAEVDAALKRGTITQQEHATILRSLQGAAGTASKGYGNLSVIAQQAGYQIADVAAVAASGGDAFRAIGVQAGQFLGVMGPWGAVIGAGVTVLGLLATNLLDTGKAAEEAKRQADDYAESVKSLTSLQEKYIDTVRESQGLQPLNKDVENLRKLKIEAEQAYQTLANKKPNEAVSSWDKAYAVGYSASAPIIEADEQGKTTEFPIFQRYNRSINDKYNEMLREAQTKMVEAQRAFNEGSSAAKGTDTQKASDAIKELNEERGREIKLMQVAADARERAKAMMEAEVKVREKLKGLGVDQQKIEDQVAQARAAAASSYDQTQREDAAKKQSEADTKATEAIEKQIAALKDHAYQMTLDDRQLKIHQELLKAYESAGPRGLSVSQEQDVTYYAGSDYDAEKTKKDAEKADQDRMKSQREHMQEMRQFSNQMAASMTSAFEQAVFAGNDLRGVFSGLLDDMAKMILRATVMKPLMNWLTGGIDSLFSFGSGTASAASSVASSEAASFAEFHHGGGVAGSGASMRSVPAGLFDHAPRYHGGGVAGLRPDEVPAVLQRGEVVLPRHVAQASGASVTIVQNNTIQIQSPSSSSTDYSALLQQISSRLSVMTKAAVMQVLTEQKRSGGLLAGT